MEGVGVDWVKMDQSVEIPKKTYSSCRLLHIQNL